MAKIGQEEKDAPILELSSTVPLQRQKSLQSSILFMQQEHAKTLAALHDEIHRLQKRCAELTFNMAMGTTSSPDEDFYREKSEKLEEELKGKSQCLGEVTSTLEKREKRVTSLEQQLRAQEKKYQDLLKQKEQQVRQLKAELADKASLNAELMLHRLSVSQEGVPANGLYCVTTGGNAPSPPTPPSDDRDVSANTPSPRTTAAVAMAGRPHTQSPMPPLRAPHPPPPQQQSSATQRVRRRTSPRAIVTEGEPVLSAHLRTRAASGRALRRSDTPDEVPDPTPFLQRRDNAHASTVPYPPSATKFDTPLPPINPRNHQPYIPSRSTNVARVSAASPVEGHTHTFVPKPKAVRHHHHHHQHHHKQSPTTTVTAVNEQSSGSSSSPEVEVLAVDTVIKRSHKLRRAQEYNAD